jgi:predicted ATP-dependent serine protease
MANVNLGFKATEFKQASLIEIPEIFYHRFRTGIDTFDNLLGGQGFLPGSTFTITGAPGAGKTTFLLQLLESLQRMGKMTGYISSEESIYQLAYTCERLGITQVQIANMSDVDEIAKQAANFDVLVIDSFQFLSCIHTDKPLSTQKYAAQTLVRAAQQHECVIGIIQHVTVTGSAKGGTLLPHAVDMNIQIANHSADADIKTIEVYKNRFGMCGEILLKMTETGFDFDYKPDDNVEQSEKFKSAVENGKRERQHIIDYLTKHNRATIEDLLIEEIPDWRIPHYLRILAKEGAIVKVGRGNEAYWKIAKSEKQG